VRIVNLQEQLKENLEAHKSELAAERDKTEEYGSDIYNANMEIARLENELAEKNNRGSR
jgi:septal ring factor EnvC (AmiA/AmiB activator)